MQIKLYENDEFSITYDTELQDFTCINMCMQCPLYLEHNGKPEDCKKIIQSKILSGELN